MAVNIKALKAAMGTGGGGSSGWNYSAMRDGYEGPNGQFISKMDIAVEGSFAKAFAKKYGANGPAGPYSAAIHSSGSNPPSNPSFGDLWNDDVNGKMYVYTQGGWVDTAINATVNTANIPVASISSSGNLSIGTGTQQYAFHQPTTSVIAIETKVGRVGVNIETGDITIPPGIGRDVAAREFWLSFQEHFKPVNTAKYETQIEGLKRDYVRLETYYKEKLTNIEKAAAKPIIEKVRKKYGNEKFIMVKPEDLIKFIEQD